MEVGQRHSLMPPLVRAPLRLTLGWFFVSMIAEEAMLSIKVDAVRASPCMRYPYIHGTPMLSRGIVLSVGCHEKGPPLSIPGIPRPSSLQLSTLYVQQASPWIRCSPNGLLIGL